MIIDNKEKENACNHFLEILFSKFHVKYIFLKGDLDNFIKARELLQEK